ncbi:polypyrimidine tract-binding protein 3 isoform X3 [Eupeodes corollae]|nr:polypyrimidine tract-binding protein 3 isoform X3 [Eupeodes corollae]XP_055904790.1 polypyrimidine tract-binding protein 3 isoform X3 [Eupeodes corollae]XP_055904860.1 polypyrimidine tract-binding protein 3 isoform X3 [Eupeodes corollae]XP_055904930.1 polypyrimidine tract-binding protein 3 isoform X3 [Eupeodes corollae]XP_055905000.1 polypyrimidine tract-binding protein 3 isoform X3 [Eupeodes corollae]XP_055905071.1 polypyrimidine tract-binding protein 3 isoform X3 [Eupeodes corollae]
MQLIQSLPHPNHLHHHHPLQQSQQETLQLQQYHQQMQLQQQHQQQQQQQQHQMQFQQQQQQQQHQQIQMLQTYMQMQVATSATQQQQFCGGSPPLTPLQHQQQSAAHHFAATMASYNPAAITLIPFATCSSPTNNNNVNSNINHTNTKCFISNTHNTNTNGITNAILPAFGQNNTNNNHNNCASSALLSIDNNHNHHLNRINLINRELLQNGGGNNNDIDNNNININMNMISGPGSSDGADSMANLTTSTTATTNANTTNGRYSSASSDCSMPSPSSHYSSPNKRGSDELLSQAAVMAPASDNNNQDLATKKAKLDSGTVLGGVCKPSKVIHLRNIPNESSEPDVISLGIPFGRVTNVLVLKGKNQAFLEMADEVSATAMVTCYTHNPPQMRGRMVYVQFSNHRELKTDQSHTIGSTALVPVSASDYIKIQSPGSGSPLPLCGATATEGSQTVMLNNSNSTTQGGPNTVLRVIVESLLYPVSLDILHQIFQRFGKVLKIVTFTKNNSFQALIQYPDAQSAQHAKNILDGQNIYNGCCTLRIDNSKLTALNVKYNNDKSRDFTNPSLPPGEPGADLIPQAGGLVNANDLLLIAARQRPALTGDKLVNGLGAPGVLPPFALGIGTQLTGGYSSGIPSLGAFALANSGALTTATPALRGFSNVLLVSNLNEEMVTPDALFTLFGVYGDVQRVKILYNKKDSALIQMAEPQQAYLAMTHLDKLRLWGKSIRVMASKHQAVQLPKEGQPDAGLTRDYSQNPLHRFKKPGSKNYQNIYPPSATLHLSNIPASCTEEDIKEAFTTNNFEVKAFKFFPKDRKMALLQLSSVEEAVLALIKMHNHQLSESNHLRVSFSKSNI